MTTDWKALCAQLAENIRYLLDCVADGDSDPVAIAECVQHLGATRAHLSQPEPEEPSDRIISIAMAVQECASAWEPTARLIGNVCAKDIADLCGVVLARWGRPATPHGDTMTTERELIQRLLLLAEQAVKEALDFDYGDPEDRHIWRELQELKQLVEKHGCS